MFERIDKNYDKNSLQTPLYMIAWLNSIYSFDVDLAASDEYHCFDRYITKEEDSTTADWCLYGDNGFLNPPYGRGEIQPFIDNAILKAKDRFTTVMLIPELNGESRTKDILNNAKKIYHFDQRISYIHPLTGEECKGNNRGSIVIEFGYQYIKSTPNHIFIDLSEIKRKFNKLDIKEDK